MNRAIFRTTVVSFLALIVLALPALIPTTALASSQTISVYGVVSSVSTSTVVVSNLAGTWTANLTGSTVVTPNNGSATSTAVIVPDDLVTVTGALSGTSTISATTIADDTATSLQNGHSVYHVNETTGSDNNPGTATYPFKTIAKALTKLQPGDTLVIDGGTYPTAQTINLSGTSGAWITITGDPDLPTIDPAGIAFNITGSYIQISNLNITASSPGFYDAGVAINPGSNHIRVIGNYIHDEGDAGIIAIRSDYLTIQGNYVDHNSFLDTNDSSGIDIYEAVNYDTAPGFHIVIEGNISTDNYDPDNPVCDCSTDGEGIIIDDFNGDQVYDGTTEPRYTASTLIENNIVYNNGGRGISIGNSANVTVRNNIAWDNEQDSYLDTTGHSGDIALQGATSTSVFNNISITSSPRFYPFADSQGLNNTFDYNIAVGTSTDGYVNYDSMDSIWGSNNIVGIDPDFMNPSTATSSWPTILTDFSLQPGSIAIGAGTSADAATSDISGIQRSPSFIDIGAQQQSTTTTVTIGSLTPTNGITDVGAPISFMATANNMSASPTYSVGDSFSGASLTETAINATSGAFSWTPSTADIGTHDVSISATDSLAESAQTQRLLIVDAAPAASNASASVNENASTTIPLNGTGGSAALSYTASSTSENGGTVSLTGNLATYTPASGFTGNDAFTFVVTDGLATSAPATVMVIVNSTASPPASSATSGGGSGPPVGYLTSEVLQQASLSSDQTSSATSSASSSDATRPALLSTTSDEVNDGRDQYIALLQYYISLLQELLHLLQLRAR